MTNKQRAKVDLVTGFLGAGKTTFIRKYMKYLDERGISYLVIENEFGAAGVDASILGSNVRELSGGCICCGQKVNFHNLLIEVAHEADRIIVEPSGVFNADDFFDIMDSPQVKEAAQFGFMAGVVNPLALDGLTEAAERVLFSELICAGALLLSHTDEADEAAILRAKEHIARITSVQLPVFDANELDFDRLCAYSPVRREHDRDRTDHSTLFQSTVVYPKGVWSESALRSAAERLFSGEAGQVLRVKGTASAEDGALTVNATPGCIEIVRSEGEVGINVIGRALNRRFIRAVMGV